MGLKLCKYPGMKDYKDKQIELKRAAGLVYRPKTGRDYNPALKYPVNEPCFCGSGIKFKKCCKDKLPSTLPQKDAEAVRPLVRAARGK